MLSFGWALWHPKWNWGPVTKKWEDQPAVSVIGSYLSWIPWVKIIFSGQHYFLPNTGSGGWGLVEKQTSLYSNTLKLGGKPGQEGMILTKDVGNHFHRWKSAKLFYCRCYLGKWVFLNDYNKSIFQFCLGNNQLTSTQKKQLFNSVLAVSKFHSDSD